MREGKRIFQNLADGLRFDAVPPRRHAASGSSSCSLWFLSDQMNLRDGRARRDPAPPREKAKPAWPRSLSASWVGHTTR
jgi:hypothetical protein